MGVTLQSSTDFNQTAYDLKAWFALRPELEFDDFADVQSTNESMVGKSVTFTIVNDISAQTTALTDGTDVTPITISDSQLNVVLTEFGAAISTSAKMRGTSFVDIDPVVANLLGFNAGLTINAIARNALAAGTSVFYASGGGATAPQTSVTARGGLTSTNTIAAVDAGAARARLVGANVQKFGNLYTAFVHPDVGFDLMNEVISGSQVQGWTAANVYSDPSNIHNGELGQYRGFRWIETPTAPVFVGQGSSDTETLSTPLVSGTAYTSLVLTSSITTTTGEVLTLSSGDNVQQFIVSSGATSATQAVTSAVANYSYPSGSNVATGAATNVYGTLFTGRQSLAKAYSSAPGFGPLPHVFPGPVIDILRRIQPNGWYFLGQYSVFRQASVIRLESVSTLGGDVGGIWDPDVNA